ncbi:SirB1 family protein [Telmatospirillum sp. J64-1]|uniref:SirB1 family protein n=1 Tax=Telmatospirillum sp. J64-1 TaxID=2502183 RepID=UPI00115E6F0C|nr:transglutaminase-like domain-containing protein [Telmatospirillum sp. J64-1]
MAEKDALREELARLATLEDERIDLAGVALTLAALHLETPRLEEAYTHLDEIVADLAGLAAEAVQPEEKAAALTEVLAVRWGYAGDDEDYDNLDNGNLIRVIERRRGLPVALGILWIHAGRSQGWSIEGLSFPAHFLLRIEDDSGRRVIIDPFHAGRLVDAAGLRELLKTFAGTAAELEPAHYAPVGNRDILLRLQNNNKLRLLRGGRLEEALEIVEEMLLFAPEELLLWREAGMIHVRLGNTRAAIAALEQFVARAPNGAMRTRAVMLLRDLRERLH